MYVYQGVGMGMCGRYGALVAVDGHFVRLQPILDEGFDMIPECSQMLVRHIVHLPIFRALQAHSES